MHIEYEREPFDVAVVAWDLQPPWDASSAACRWEELKSLHRGIANSTRLSSDWRTAAQRRLTELETRAIPTARQTTPKVEKFAVLPMWMKPDFEGLIANEAAVREALGARGLSLRGWPNDWSEQGPRRMDAVLDQAIEVARKHRPRLTIFRVCGLPFRSAKHTWASLLISRGGKKMNAHMKAHSSGRRLSELLG